MSLFSPNLDPSTNPSLKRAPLAERMRPRTLDEFFGQTHLLAAGKPLRLQIENDDAASLIFWVHLASAKQLSPRSLPTSRRPPSSSFPPCSLASRKSSR